MGWLLAVAAAGFSGLDFDGSDLRRRLEIYGALQQAMQPPDVRQLQRNGEADESTTTEVAQYSVGASPGREHTVVDAALCLTSRRV